MSTLPEILLYSLERKNLALEPEYRDEVEQHLDLMEKSAGL